MNSRPAIRAIACFEAFKGVVVLVAATGVARLMHKDLGDIAERLVEHAHFNPASRYPRIFLDAVERVQDTRLLWLAGGAAAYVTLRFAEAYGLFRERAWAEWLAALSGGLYVPLEIAKLVDRPSTLGAAVLIGNLAVVAVMVWALLQRRKLRP